MSRGRWSSSSLEDSLEAVRRAGVSTRPLSTELSEQQQRFTDARAALKAWIGSEHGLADDDTLDAELEVLYTAVETAEAELIDWSFAVLVESPEWRRQSAVNRSLVLELYEDTSPRVRGRLVEMAMRLRV